jgi:hypothetical protein
MNKLTLTAIVVAMSLPVAAVYAQSGTNTATPDQAGRASPSSAAGQEGAANPDVSGKGLSRPQGSGTSNPGTGSTSSRSSAGNVAKPDAAGRASPSSAAGQEGAANPDVTSPGAAGTR